MPTITANTTDGYVGNFAFSGPSFSSIRDATSGTQSSATAGNYRFAPRFVASTGRGGFYDIRRTFFAFDTSVITSTVASATINIYGDTNGTLDIIGVKATRPDLVNPIVSADFDAITGFSAGSSMAGNVTDYTAEVTSWSTSGYNSITLNAAALSDLQSLSVFAICFVGYDNDYLNVDPGFSSGINQNTGMYYANATDAAKRPYIDYTIAAAASEIDKINAIAIASVDKIDGTAKANYSKVLGIDLP